MRRKLISLLLLLLSPAALLAHVGSPDFYDDGYAGPYHLLVTIRPPAVIPGIAEIEIRSISGGLDRVEITPLRLVGQGATLAPTPDVAERSSNDPQLFTGKLWIMSRGSWKVQINAEGAQGKGEFAVPFAAVSTTSMRMQKSLGGLLAGLGLLLVVGLVGIVSAANRDAVLAPGVSLSSSQRRRSLIITTVATVLLTGAVIFGNFWWTADASHTERLSYKLPHAQLSLAAANVLHLSLQNPNDIMWRQYPSELQDPDRVRLDDLIPDHGHILHLFLVRMPDMTSFWHLHPKQTGVGNFAQTLPSLPAGHYQVFADIVHQTGFPETQVAEIDLPAVEAPDFSPGSLSFRASEKDRGNGALGLSAPGGDDSGGTNLTAGEKFSQLSDGYRMVWERDSSPFRVNQPTWFRFRLEDKNGNPATDLEPYMGMAGHAAFIRNDGQVFAHVHPAGSISMAAAELAQGESSAFTTGSASGSSTMPAMPGSMDRSVPCGTSRPAVDSLPKARPGEPQVRRGGSPTTCSAVSFPYGFPQPGDYHIFVQIKRGGKIETAVFLAHVTN